MERGKKEERPKEGSLFSAESLILKLHKDYNQHK